MGRRQGETDLRTLQKHILESEIQQERIQWVKKTFDRPLDRRQAHLRKYATWAYRNMTLLAFQVMVNEVARDSGMRKVRYRGR